MNALFRKTVALVVYVSFLSVHVFGCGVQSGAPIQVGYRSDPLPSFVLPTPLPPPAASSFEVLQPESELEDFSPDLTVTSSGAATWTHPLQLLPGRNGMSPSLSISYSSSGGAGALGRGFSLDGTESIARCWPVRAQGTGAAAAPLVRGVSSVFCLNGTRLMPRPNESPDRLSPERDPSTLVVVAGGLANPTSFTVYRSNGLITGFGARPFSSARREGRLRTLVGTRLQGNPSSSFSTDDLSDVQSSSQTTVEWKQDVTRDRYGNEVRYDYDARLNASGDVVELLLREVSWTANTQQSLDAKRRARLTYGQDRPDARSGFRMGLPVESTKLLTSVEVFGPSGLTSDATHTEVLHWGYEFTYRQVKEGTHQEGVLDTMRRCFPSGSCTTPVRFEWQGFEQANPVFSLQSPQDNTVDYSTPWSSYDGVLGAYDLSVADFDNDGFDDALYRVPHMMVDNLGNQRPERDLPSSPCVLTDWRLRRGGPAGLSAVEKPLGLPTICGSSSKFTPRAVDLDGDGKVELLLYFEDMANNGGVTAGYASYSLNGTSFSELNRESTNPYFVTVGEVRRAAPMTLGDFDNNGTIDMVRDLPPAGSATVGTSGPDFLSMRDVIQRGTTTCQLHSGVFGQPNALLHFDPLGGARGLNVFDFGERLALDADGDGQTDLVQDIDRQECIPERTSNFAGDPIPSLTHWTLSTASRVSGTTFAIAETALPAGPLEKSPLAARVFGACVPRPIANTVPTQCAPNFDRDSRTAMARLVGDFNGDGLRDVLSFPSRYRGGCGCLRNVFTGALMNCSDIDYSTQVFLNINRGNAFAPVEVLSNPWTASGTTSALPSSIRAGNQPYAAGRPIDNGLRVVDLDGDGNDDIVQVATQAHAGEPMKLFRFHNGGFNTTKLNVPFAHPGLWLPEEVTMNPRSIDGDGPRMTQFGDVNGDGQVDIVTMTDRLAGRVTAYLQEPRAPLLLVGISSAATAGQTLVYGWGRGVPTNRLNDPRPGAPRSTANHVALYNRSVTCAAPLRCLPNIGWVVSSQMLASGAVITHSYADARIDTNGRGVLGVAEHRMLIGKVEVVDLFDHSLIGVPGSADGYVYRQPDVPRWHVVRGATQREVEFTTNPGRSVTISSEFERADLLHLGGTWPLLRSTREVVERDSHHMTIQTLTTTSDQLLPGHADNYVANAAMVGNWEQTEIRRSGVGADCETASACGGGEGWLLGRYPDLKHTYRRNAGTEESIVWQLAYEPLTLDVHSSTKNRDGVGSQNSGYLRQMVLTHDALGNVTQMVETGSGPGSNNSPTTRTTTVAFATNDLERVFSHALTNALGMAEFEHRLAASGLPIALDDISARRVAMAYDEAGRPVRTTPPVGRETAFSYATDASGVTRRVVRGGFAVSTKFNRAGQLVRKLEEGRSFTLFQYDPLGRLEKESLPLAWSADDSTALFVIHERDDDGRVIATTRPGESATAARRRRSVSYNRNVVTRMSESGGREETTLDALGRPSVVTAFATNGEDAITRYEYGRWGKLEQITHPWSTGAGPGAPAKTVINYDAYGRRLTLNDPDTGLTRSEYTAFNELYSSTDGTAATTTYSWDALGRILLEETPVGTYKALDASSPFSRRNVFEYDSAPNGLGQLARATSMASPTSGSHFVGEVTTTWQYDAFGRTTATQWNEAGTQRTFEYVYDPFTAELSTLKYPRFETAGTAVSVWAEFRRDVDGSVMGVDSVVGGQRQQVWRATQLDPVGQIVEEVFGSAITGTRRYDASYALRFQEVRPQRSSASFQRLSYTWGADGLLSRRTDLDLWSEEQFEHDAFQRLTKWTVKQNCIANEWRYSFDPSGNLLTRALHPNGGAATHATTFTYDAATPHRAMNSRIESTDFSLKYHPGGQVREAMGNQYEWTPFGLPVSMTTLASGITRQLTYDAFGSRTSALTNNAERTVTLAGLYELRSTLARQEATYNLQGRDGVVAQLQLSQDFSTPNVENTTRYLHLDHLGNPDAISTESNGTPRLLERGKYAPFGERRSPWALATPLPQAPTQTAYGFTGHAFDVDQGITNMRGRLYDQRLARFLSPDPIAHPVGQALNRYSYVRNSPAILTDPSGFDPPTRKVDFDEETVVGEHKRRVVIWAPVSEAGDVGRSSDDSFQRIAAAPRYPFYQPNICFDVLRFETKQVFALHPVAQLEVARQLEIVTGIKVQEVALVEARKKVELNERFESAVWMATAVSLSSLLELRTVSVGVGPLTIFAPHLRSSAARGAGSGKLFSGTEKGWSSGATPNSKYVQVHPKSGKAIQTTIYDKGGNAVGHVDWKAQHGAGSGHGHVLAPGDLGSGHGGKGTFYPPGELPAGWGELPPGVGPIHPLGGN
jgi:RHS repeat-associated protein